MTKHQKQRKRLLALIVVLSVILAGLCGVAYAKYVQETTLNGTVNITAELGIVQVLEHVANRNDDGSYSLGKDTTSEKNEYTLIPGLDIPKDPYVVVSNKSTVPAYIFLEVTDNITDDKIISYTIDPDHWKKLEGVDGQVYVYIENGSPKAVTSNIDPINILEDQTVYVSQNLKDYEGETPISINFTVSMKQATGEAKDIY